MSTQRYAPRRLVIGLMALGLASTLAIASSTAHAQGDPNAFRAELRTHLLRMQALLLAHAETSPAAAEQVAPGLDAVAPALAALDSYDDERIAAVYDSLAGVLPALRPVEDLLETVVAESSQRAAPQALGAATSSFCPGRPVNFQAGLYSAGPPGEHECYIVDFPLVAAYEAIPCVEVISCAIKAVAVAAWTVNQGFCRDYNRENELDTLCLLEDTKSAVDTRASQTSLSSHDADVKSEIATVQALVGANGAKIDAILANQATLLGNQQEILANQAELKTLLLTPQGRRPGFPQ